MRVLVPWKSKECCGENDPSDNEDSYSDCSSSSESSDSFVSIEESQQPTDNSSVELQAVDETRKRAAASSPETVDSANKRTSRPRLAGGDCKPAAVAKSSPENKKMTAGGRGLWDREDESTIPKENGNLLILENEPPHHYNNNGRTSEEPQFENTSDYVDTESRFRVAMKQRGLEVVNQKGDGNCLFRAVALQVYGDANMHDKVRHQCMDFMARDPQHFGAFVSEPFDAYVKRKRQLGEHGNHAEIQACSELFNRPVQVYEVHTSPDFSPMNIFHAEYKTGDQPIRLSYHDRNHYNAVIDPLVPTAGLGLGLPGLKPGLADQMQVSRAVCESDADADLKFALKASAKDEDDRVTKESRDDLQRALKESTYSMDAMYNNKALALSDLDATNFELEQKALEHSLKSYRRNECRKQSPVARRTEPPSPTSDSTSSSPFAPAPAAAAALNPPAASIPPAAAAAAAAGVASMPPSPPHFASVAVDYPPVVHELAMNGFDRAKVIRAYELIGDNFDDLLAFLMQSS